MILTLFNRRTDNADAHWKDETVTIENVCMVTSTYMNLVRVNFQSFQDAEIAQAITGWNRWDTRVLGMCFYNDMVELQPPGEEWKYFADWKVTENG